MNTKSPKRGRPPLPKGQAATEQIQLRVQPARRKAYMRAKLRASPDPKKPISLVKWIFNELDRAAGYSELPDEVSEDLQAENHEQDKQDDPTSTANVRPRGIWHEHPNNGQNEKHPI